VDFFHWLLVDLPPTLAGIAEGEFSRGFSARGKPGPAAPHGARQGVNDYTGWFAGNAEMAGQYFGYDGPFPPFNDSLVHHYVFTLYALDVARLPLEGAFNGAQVRKAIAGHVIDAATYSGTYTLNRRLLA
jgi:Raf kinase inhibitor-like YbhB/YbcL family protein